MSAAGPPASWRVVLAAGAELGERPLWDARDGTVVWVDVLAGRVHRSRPDALPTRQWADTSTVVGRTVGCVALREDGGMLAAADSAIRWLDASGRDDADPVVMDMPHGHRFNDGACDPAGRLLVGTAGPKARGLLWSLAADRSVRTLLEGLGESNGLGWSRTEDTLYLIDSVEPVVRRYDYDADSGRIGMRRSDLVSLAARPGSPDGLVVDRLGRVWVPQWQGGEINCIDEDGSVVMTWPVPTTQPTCAGFAGATSSTLVLTTSWESMSHSQRVDDRWAGHVLVADQEVPGLAPARFGSGRTRRRPHRAARH